MDAIDDGAQPRCPEDGIVMRDIEGGWQCPQCQHVIAPVVKISMPPAFRGPTIHDGHPGDSEYV
ncbi:hypothetical protein [Microbacterium sp. NPDC058389]|uniref:hypothetical protein n=1 Tax=Microbacterium sp. NPDC058389 TaxID=3346475 RepID=UPI00365DAAF7